MLDWCRQGKLKGYISKKVVYEVHNNNLKDQNTIGEMRFTEVLSHGFLTITDDASQEETKNANEAFHNLKDAPIIASAKQIARVRYILSLDNGFFRPDITAYVRPAEIIKPGVFVQRFRSELESSPAGS